MTDNIDLYTNTKKRKENEKTHRSRQLEDEHNSCRGR